LRCVRLSVIQVVAVLNGSVFERACVLRRWAWYFSRVWLVNCSPSACALRPNSFLFGGGKCAGSPTLRNKLPLSLSYIVRWCHTSLHQPRSRCCVCPLPLPHRNDASVRCLLAFVFPLQMTVQPALHRRFSSHEVVALWGVLLPDRCVFVWCWF